jgi:hypothetical protein
MEMTGEGVGDERWIPLEEQTSLALLGIELVI